MRMEGPSEAELKTYYGIVLKYEEDQLCSETIKMTKEEFITKLSDDTPLGKARRVFSSEAGRIEQALQQRDPPGAVALRMMEFEAAKKIAVVLGVNL